jgi:membrane protein
MKWLYEAWSILAEAGSDWLEDKAARLGAALAFYSVLSIAPLMVITLALASLILDRNAAREQLATEMGGLVGKEGAKLIETMLDNGTKFSGTFTTILGIATLLFGASGVFGELQDAMNTIWEVKPKPNQGIWGVIRTRFLSFAMVLGTGFLLLVSLILTSSVAGAGSYFGRAMPALEPLVHLLTNAVSFAVVTLMFMLIFKFLPDAEVAWRDVWVGALLTAGLFTMGKMLIGFYLGKSGLGSAYGAAGSVVVLIVWVYYSAQILFFGAELTQVIAGRYGTRIVPTENAEPVTADARAQQGLRPAKSRYEEPLKD